MVSVRVRLFAAAREAAGEPETAVPAGPLPQVLGSLQKRYDERFGSVLAVASVLVDGTHVERGEELHVADGSEVAILPPFSGG